MSTLWFRSATLVCVSVLTLTPIRSSSAEEWTSLETNRSVQATFLGMWQDSVVLRLTDGRRVVIEKAKLDAASRMQADDLAAAKAEIRTTRLGELKRSLSGTGGSASTIEAAEYNAIPEQASLPDFVQHVAKEIEAGHLRALWDAMPKSYQDDLSEVVRLSFQSIDAQDFLVSQRVTGQLGRTLAKQREFAFNYPLMSEIPSDQVDNLKVVYTALAGILSAVGDTKLVEIELWKQGDMNEIVNRLDSRLAPHVATLTRLAGTNSDGFAELTAISSSNVNMEGPDRGSITIAGPAGEPSTQIFVRIDGKWLPEPMVTGWSEGMQNAKRQLAMAAENPPTTGGAAVGLGMVGAALGNIESAETQEEFNEIIDMYVQTLAGLFEAQMGQLADAQLGAGAAAGMNGAMGGQGGGQMYGGGYPGSGMPSGPGGNSGGYGDGYDEEYEQQMKGNAGPGSSAQGGPGSSAHGGPGGASHGGS